MCTTFSAAMQLSYRCWDARGLVDLKRDVASHSTHTTFSHQVHACGVLYMRGRSQSQIRKRTHILRALSTTRYGQVCHRHLKHYYTNCYTDTVGQHGHIHDIHKQHVARQLEAATFDATCVTLSVQTPEQRQYRALSGRILEQTVRCHA